MARRGGRASFTGPEPCGPACPVHPCDTWKPSSPEQSSQVPQSPDTSCCSQSHVQACLQHGGRPVPGPCMYSLGGCHASHRPRRHTGGQWAPCPVARADFLSDRRKPQSPRACHVPAAGRVVGLQAFSSPVGWAGLPDRQDVGPPASITLWGPGCSQCPHSRAIIYKKRDQLPGMPGTAGLQAGDFRRELLHLAGVFTAGSRCSLEGPCRLTCPPSPGANTQGW